MNSKPNKLTVDQMPSSKTLANETGQRFYFNGKPCRNGHVSPRYASNGVCAQCCRDIYKRKYIPKSRKTKKNSGAEPVPRKSYYYKQYLDDLKLMDQIETISITVEKGSSIANHLTKIKKALESLDLNCPYGNDRLTILQMHSTREEAKRDGHSHFFTGEACLKGHVAPRTIRGECNQCVRDSSKRAIEKKQLNPESKKQIKTFVHLLKKKLKKTE